MLLSLSTFRHEVLLRRFPQALGTLLAIPHRSVGAAASEQSAMRAAFDNHAIIQHQNLVGTDNGRQTMRDYQRSASRGKFVEARLDFVLGM